MKLTREKINEWRAIFVNETITFRDVEALRKAANEKVALCDMALASLPSSDEVVVPAVPTERMEEAGAATLNDHWFIPRNCLSMMVYKAMISASSKGTNDEQG